VALIGCFLAKNNIANLCSIAWSARESWRNHRPDAIQVRVGALSRLMSLASAACMTATRAFEQCLAQTLARRDIVIMDRLPAHKVAGVLEAIEAVGATVLYLPSHSPDLNPIEQFFSKLKALLRNAAEQPIPDLWRP
jgi:hypothetical protein